MNCEEKCKAIDAAAFEELIAKAGLYDYGTIGGAVADKIAAAKAECVGAMMVAAGLSNNDFEHIVLGDAAKAAAGLKIVACALGAEKAVLYVPENETAYAEAAKAAGAEVEPGIVNTRMFRDGLILHLTTCEKICDLVHGKYVADTVVAADVYTTSESCERVLAPKAVAFGTKISDLGLELADAKAVQIGQKLYTPAEAAEVVLAPELPLGDGVIRVYGNGVCMVDAAAKKLLASRVASCGKCTFCREGLNQLYIRSTEITGRKGTFEATEMMEEIGEAMTFSCNCSIGNYGSIFTLEAMKMFENEYTDHIKRKKCTVGTCLAFVNVYVDPAKCVGCGKCIPECPVDCIEGMPGYIHIIEDIDCTKCGKCLESCAEGAIIRTTGNVPRLPDRMTRVGRFKRY